MKELLQTGSTRSGEANGESQITGREIGGSVPAVVELR